MGLIMKILLIIFLSVPIFCISLIFTLWVLYLIGTIINALNKTKIKEVKEDEQMYSTCEDYKRARDKAN